MLILWGIDCVIQFTGIAFPASVAGMLILFGGLIGLEATIGERKVREIFRVIDVPVSPHLISIVAELQLITIYRAVLC